MPGEIERSSAAEDRHEAVLHELRRDLTRKIVAMAKEGTTHQADGVLDVDVSFFLDPDLFAREPFQHIGILSLEFHVDKLSRPLL